MTAEGEMLIFQAVGSDQEIYVDPTAIIAIEDKGEAGTHVHLTGGQTVAVDAMASKIVAQMSEVGLSVRVPARLR